MLASKPVQLDSAEASQANCRAEGLCRFHLHLGSPELGLAELSFDQSSERSIVSMASLVRFFASDSIILRLANGSGSSQICFLTLLNLHPLPDFKYHLSQALPNSVVNHVLAHSAGLLRMVSELQSYQPWESVD